MSHASRQDLATFTPAPKRAVVERTASCPRLAAPRHLGAPLIGALLLGCTGGGKAPQPAGENIIVAGPPPSAEIGTPPPERVVANPAPPARASASTDATQALLPPMPVAAEPKGEAVAVPPGASETPAVPAAPSASPPAGGAGSSTMTAHADAGRASAGAGGVSANAGGASAGAGGAGGAPDSAAGGSPPQPPKGDGPANPSGLPEPGAGSEAQPSGSPDGIEVLPWAGFTAAVTYSFDDSNSSQVNNETQLLGLGVPFTWYLQTGKDSSGATFYGNALAAGHELANHTRSHGSGAADADINSAQDYLRERYGVTAYTMAAPNGRTNNYTDIARRLFIIDRGVGDGLIDADSPGNPYNLNSYIPPQGADAGPLNAKAEAARAQGKWQTYCIHGFVGGTDGAYKPIQLAGFVEHVENVKAMGDVWIGTMVAVGAYWIGRQAVMKAQVTTDGASQVLSWSLPDVFPPGHHVRILTDGGTVSQDGRVLPWNEHGFYEVALDSGRLTLTP